MKDRPIQIIPLSITVAVVLLAVLVHAASRHVADQPRDAAAKRRVDLSLLEQIEAITYDFRVRLGAAWLSSNSIPTNMATLFFDDFAVEKVNDGSWSYYYAPAMDDKSARKLYPRLWPWPRFIHGQIVRELAAEGAVAAGFDIMFPELSEDREEERVPDLLGNTASSDEFFAREMREAGNVFLGVDADTVPAELFRTNAAGLASISARADHAVLRRVKPFHEVRIWHPLLRELIKPLGLQLTQAKIEPGKKVIIPVISTEPNAPPFEIPLNPNGSMKMTADGNIDTADDPNDEGPGDVKPFEVHKVWNLGITLAAKALGLDLNRAEIQERKIILRGASGIERIIPLDSAGYFLIDWSIRFEDLKNKKTPIYYGNLGEVLINDKGRSSLQPNDFAPYTNRIVLIGSVANGNNMADFGATPLESQTPLVTKHLNIASSILTGRFVERTSLGVEAMLILVLGLVSGLLTWRLRVLSASIAVAILCVAYVAFTVWMYLGSRYWIPIVLPVGGGLILPHFSLVTYRVIFEQKEQRRVRGIFSKIVSPDVVQELLSAEKLALGGARRRITIFFADVRGFTEFTDSTQQAAEDFVRKSNLGDEEQRQYFDAVAAEQIATVNLYLATIADTIKAHHGTLDKYMGDCVMAFWGAPTPNERHALACVRAAIDSQRALHKLNQERMAENERRKTENNARAAAGKQPLPLLPLLSLGTGINTGFATVGLMGSDATILNYTVFGREVNLASRLEGASGRGRILISESTFADLQRDDPALAATCIPQAPITPKGFRQPIRIYEVPWKPASSAAPAAPAAETPAAEQKPAVAA